MSYRDDPREHELRALRSERAALRKLVLSYRKCLVIMRDNDFGCASETWRAAIDRVDRVLAGDP